MNAVSPALSVCNRRFPSSWLRYSHCTGYNVSDTALFRLFTVASPNLWQNSKNCGICVVIWLQQPDIGYNISYNI